MADPASLAHLYKCLILPTLDYCSVVWDPAAAYLITKLESVQRLAARLTTKRWSASPDNLLNSLKWTTLWARRKKQKVMVCARILNGCSIIPPTHFSLHPHPNQRLHHSCPLSTPFARTSTYQASFFISCAHLWNSLPDYMSVPFEVTWDTPPKEAGRFNNWDDIVADKNIDNWGCTLARKHNHFGLFGIQRESSIPHPVWEFVNISL